MPIQSEYTGTFHTAISCSVEQCTHDYLLLFLIVREHVETLEVDACMVATGRVPATQGMGLEDSGIETMRGFIAVDEKMRVLTKHEDGEVVPEREAIGADPLARAGAHPGNRQGAAGAGAGGPHASRTVGRGK